MNIILNIYRGNEYVHYITYTPLVPIKHKGLEKVMFCEVPLSTADDKCGLSEGSLVLFSFQNDSKIQSCSFKSELLGGNLTCRTH